MKRCTGFPVSKPKRSEDLHNIEVVKLILYLNTFSLFI